MPDTADACLSYLGLHFISEGAHVPYRDCDGSVKKRLAQLRNKLITR